MLDPLVLEKNNIAGFAPPFAQNSGEKKLPEGSIFEDAGTS